MRLGSAYGIGLLALNETQATARDVQRRRALPWLLRRPPLRWWLRDHVGMLLDADTPILMIGEKTLWRVPIYISFSHTGRFCDLGSANVDASTGEIVDPEGVKKTLEDYYEK
mgnify:CR=1 FL=1